MTAAFAQNARIDDRERSSSNLDDDLWMFRVVDYLDASAEWANLLPRQDADPSAARPPSGWPRAARRRKPVRIKTSAGTVLVTADRGRVVQDVLVAALEQAGEIVKQFAA